MCMFQWIEIQNMHTQIILHFVRSHIQNNISNTKSISFCIKHNMIVIYNILIQINEIKSNIGIHENQFLVTTPREKKK